MQSATVPERQQTGPADPEASAPDPDAATPGHGERVHPVEARAGSRFGIWKILAASLVIAVAGMALITLLFNS